MKIDNLTRDQMEKALLMWEDNGSSVHGQSDGRMAVLTQYQRNPEFFLGAFEGDRLVGACIASHDGRIGWIDRLAVEPTFLGVGVERMLLDKARENLQAQRVRRVGLLVTADNLKLQQELEKCNYKVDDMMLYMYRKGDDERGD